MASRKVLTVAELNEIIESWSDAEDEIVAVTIVPPDPAGDITDEETLDEEYIPQGNEEDGIAEMAGAMEVTTRRQRLGDEDDVDDDGASSVEFDINIPEDPQPSTSSGGRRGRSRTPNAPKVPKAKKPKKVSKYKPASSFPNAKWTKQRSRASKRFPFDITATPEALTDKHFEVNRDIRGLTPIELFELFFDTEVMTFIVEHTLKYARDHNDPNFFFDEVFLRRFLGILILSGFHTLPSVADYWSTEPALGVPIIKQAMARQRFYDIKRNIHFCDNMQLDPNDKMAKLRPFFEIMNRKFMQFGVWAEELSIDEQMVPYFGRHSCKMYIRGKPIRFGYKLWCLCSASGYLYSFIPYCGASDDYDKTVGLGADVVMRLLENVTTPRRHIVYFDNFFTSHHLMCLLSEEGQCASGTVRKNRLGGAVLKEGKALPKGEHDYQFDAANQLLVCRWQDNSEVTMMSNHDQIEPSQTVRRWKKAVKNSAGDVVTAGKFVHFQQPLLYKNYNRGMGGVDLHDNAVQNYRVNIRAKRWYWPLWVSALNSAAVNAWKLHCFGSKYRKEKPMPQKDFRVKLATSLLLSNTPNHSNRSPEGEAVDDDFERPRNLPRLDGEHVVIAIPGSTRLRCQGPSQTQNRKTCGNMTRFMCKKCNVALHTKCFEKYHKKK